MFKTTFSIIMNINTPGFGRMMSPAPQLTSVAVQTTTTTMPAWEGDNKKVRVLDIVINKLNVPL